jgi:GNAT superfamily N-acetyltransferase
MVATPDLQVRRLSKADDRGHFRCGDPDLDRFFHRYAGQNQFRHHIGTTFVAVREGPILGFVTLSPGEIAADAIDPATRGRLPDYPLPILRLARLAVDERYRGQGIGRLLLRHVFCSALELRERFGCLGVVVDAKPQVLGFYEGLGFKPLAAVRGLLGDRPEPLPMFLPTRAIMIALGLGLRHDSSS